MTTKHTPGPMTVKQDEAWPFDIRIIAPDGREVLNWNLSCHTSKDKTIDDAMTARHWPPEEREEVRALNAEQLATAHLFAAAPDLLAALKEASCWIPDGSRRTPEERGAQCVTAYDVDAMIALAIAKAEGE